MRSRVWQLTCVHGHPVTSARTFLWSSCAIPGVNQLDTKHNMLYISKRDVPNTWTETWKLEVDFIERLFWSKTFGTYFTCDRSKFILTFNCTTICHVCHSTSRKIGVIQRVCQFFWKWQTFQMRYVYLVSWDFLGLRPCKQVLIYDIGLSTHEKHMNCC